MNRRPDVTKPDPLPRHWLPHAQPGDQEGQWSHATRRIMAAADPELERLRNPAAASAAMPISWSLLGSLWKPAATLAAAATVLLLLVGHPAERSESMAASIPLGLIASDGDPVALWEVLGVEADPVLALMAIQGESGGGRR